MKLLPLINNHTVELLWIIFFFKFWDRWLTKTSININSIEFPISIYEFLCISYQKEWSVLFQPVFIRTWLYCGITMNNFFFWISRQVVNKNIHKYKFDWVPYFNIRIPSYFLSERMISLVSACVTYVHALFCPQTNNNTPHIFPINNVSPSLSYLWPRCLPPWSFTDNASLASLSRSSQTIYHHQTRCANKTVSWQDEFCFLMVNISATSSSIY